MKDSRRVSAPALRAARNAAFSAGAEIFGKLATLVWTVLAARLLGQGDFGAFFYSLTFALLLSSAAEWGFNPAMVQRATSNLPLLPELFTRAVTWQLLFAVPLFLVGGAVVAAFRPSTSAQLVLFLVLGAVFLDLWSSCCRAASAAAQEQRRTSSALVAQRAATALLISVVLLAGGDVVAMAAAFLVGSLLGVVSHARAVHRIGVRFSRRHLAVPAMREFLGHTWLLGLTTLALMALFRIDAVLLGALAGDTEVGAYAAAYKLLETVLFVAFAIRSAVFPVMNVHDQPQVVVRGIESGLAAVGLVYLPFAVVCFTQAEQILALLYGSPYDEVSQGALQLLALAPALYAVAYFTNAGLQARRRFGHMLGAALFACGANIALNLVLIPEHGGAGAAFATTVSYALAALYGVVVLRRDELRLRVLRPFAEPAAASVVLAGLLLALPLPLLVEVPLGAVVYLLVWTALARRTSPEQMALARRMVLRSKG